MSPEYIRLILRDWYNCNARVTITLRNGRQFTGKLDHGTWKEIQKGEGVVTLMQEAVNFNERYDIDINEIVAITAVSS